MLAMAAAVTMLLPIITAMFGVVVGTIVITLLSHISSVPSSVGALGGTDKAIAALQALKQFEK